MGKFKSNDRFGSKKGFDSSRGKGDRGARPTMYRAICSECGKSCELPFRPNGEKPVFCSICFGQKEEKGGEKFERRPFASVAREERTMFKVTCSKCRKECEVPFKPRADKAVYCDNCFGKGDKNLAFSGVSSCECNCECKKNFEILNGKLDAIMKLMNACKSQVQSVEIESKDLNEEDPMLEINEEAVVNEAKNKASRTKKSASKKEHVTKTKALPKKSSKKKK